LYGKCSKGALIIVIIIVVIIQRCYVEGRSAVLSCCSRYKQNCWELLCSHNTAERQTNSLLSITRAAVAAVLLMPGAFGRQQKMRDMGVDKLFQSLLMYSDPNLTEVYVVLLYTTRRVIVYHELNIFVSI